MATVTIHDERARRLLEGALWRHISSDVIDEKASDRAFSAYEEVSRSGAGPYAETMEDALAELDRLRADIAAVRAAGPGDSVKLSIDTAALVESLECRKQSIEDDDGFWSMGPEGRELVLADHAATVRLLDQLGVAEAVA